MQAALEDALRQCALVCGRGRGRSCATQLHRTNAEDGARDACVIWALCMQLRARVANTAARPGTGAAAMSRPALLAGACSVGSKRGEGGYMAQVLDRVFDASAQGEQRGSVARAEGRRWRDFVAPGGFAVRDASGSKTTTFRWLFRCDSVAGLRSVAAAGATEPGRLHQLSGGEDVAIGSAADGARQAMPAGSPELTLGGSHGTSVAGSGFDALDMVGRWWDRGAWEGGLVAVGADHSWSGVAQTSERGMRVDMRGLNRILRLEGESKSGEGVVVVQAGCLLRDLVQYLAGVGLGLAAALPILLDQTVGGMISTGSHGSSLRAGTMSDIVEGLTIVSRSGRLLRLGCLGPETSTRGGEGHCDGLSVDGEEVLRAARMAFGRIGVVVDVALRTRPRVPVRRIQRVLEVDEFVLEAGATDRGLHAQCAQVWAHFRLGASQVLVLGLRERGVGRGSGVFRFQDLS